MKNNNWSLIGFTIGLVVVWICLLISQIHLANRAFSNQKELFRVKVDDIIDESMQRFDSVDLDLISAHIAEKLNEKGINEVFQLGLFCEDENSFHAVSDNADEKSMLEKGFQYNLLSISDEETHLDKLYIYFPNIEKRFLWDELVNRIIMFLLLVLILLCFVSFFFILFKQRKINYFRERMVHNITHELKTPVTSISLATQLMLDDSIALDRESALSYLRMISDETKTMQKLLEEVLTIFRNEQIQREREDVYVHKLLTTISEVHRLSLNECHGKLVFDFQATNDVVFGDTVHLANSFSNLIDNAIKYRKGPPVITISTRNVEDTIEISFKDNGIGIAKSDQKIIFEAFARVNTDNKHYVKGYGLGLNYVQHVVKYHKGTIKVESKLGEGATFIVSLPLKIFKTT